MLFKTNKDGTILFASRGLWSKKTYVLPNQTFKRTLKLIDSGFTLLAGVMFGGAIVMESWLFFLISTVVIVVARNYAVEHVCRHWKKTDLRITYTDIVRKYAISRTQWELWLMAFLSLCAAMYAVLKVIIEREDFIYDSFSCIVFVGISHFAIYALLLRHREGGK